MARPIDQDKRNQLLDNVGKGLAETGVTDTSLRTLADRIGTSARMLIYYFGSKEKLILDVLRHQQRQFATSDPESGTTIEDLRTYLLADWAELTSGRKMTGARLLEQVFGAACAEGSPYRDYTAQTLDGMVHTLSVRFLDAGMPRETADLRARLALSSLQGLLMMYFTADAPDHIDRSFHRIVDEVILAPW